MASEIAVSHRNEHQAGETIAARYVLKKKLGEGGMGVVWVARSVALDVDVALKLLRRELAGTQAVERMAREAQTAAQLGHPALVRVFDFGTTEFGEPFIAMELLQGEELHALLTRGGRIPAERAAGLLLPIIDGLGTAHEKGIVHRDIKPENIFIARDRQGRIQPKVLDFGIAKLDGGRPVSRLTQVGAVMGSPQYLSPEQAEGLDDVDFRTDIWSVGVMLYELVTGKLPFDGNNYNALIRSILRDTPRPTTELAAGDAQLWSIIDCCLRKKPEQRWGSMWELGEALALWLFERGIRVDASARSLRHGWLDGGLTGLQILVASEPPEARTLPPRAAAEAVVEPALSIVAVATPLPDHVQAPTPAGAAPGHKRRAWRTAALVVAVATIGAVVFAFRSRTATPKPDTVVVVPRSTVPSAEEHPKLVVPLAVAAPPPAVADVPDAAPAASELAPRGSIVVSPPAAPRPASPQRPAPDRSEGPAKAPRKASPRTANTEFGF